MKIYAIETTENLLITRVIVDTSIETIIAKWSPVEQAKIISVREISEDKLPKDRAFRDAWTDREPTETIDVDIKKAKKIHLARIRDLRNKELTKLDQDMLRNLTNAEKLKELEAQKQVLRDLPVFYNIDSINNADELKNDLPKELAHLRSELDLTKYRKDLIR